MDHGRTKVSDLLEQPLTISYSQVSQWHRCKKSWEYAYKEGLRSKTSPDYLRLGSYVHLLLEIYYNHMRYDFPPDQTRELLANFAMEKLTVDLPVDQLGVVSSALRLVLRYIDDVAPLFDAGARVLGVEYHFVKELTTPKGRKFFLQGYIDLILEIEGRIWIIDHKTTGNKIWSITELQMDGQLTTYAAAIPNVFGVGVNFFNTYDYKDWWATPYEKLYKRLTTNRSKAEQEAVLHNFRLIVDEMIDTVEYPLSLTKDCARCPFNELCLMTLKGFDETSLRLFKREAFALKSDEGDNRANAEGPDDPLDI